MLYSFWLSGFTLGLVLFGWAEQFEQPRFLNGLYFTFVTLSTIGYGDFLPTYDGTRLWACIFALGGVGIYGFIIGAIGQEVSRERRKENRDKNNTHLLKDFLQKYHELLDNAKDYDKYEKQVLIEQLQQSQIELAKSIDEMHELQVE